MNDFPPSTTSRLSLPRSPAPRSLESLKPGRKRAEYLTGSHRVPGFKDSSARPGVRPGRDTAECLHADCGARTVGAVLLVLRRWLTCALRPTWPSAVLVVFLLLQNAAAQGPAPESLTPQEWRAGVISKLPAYISWPAEKLGSETNALRLGVLQIDAADNGMSLLLSALLKDTRVDGRAVVVSQVTRPADAADYHLLYVPQEANARWWEAAADLDLRGLVTIGDSNDFLRRGGVFNLRTSSRKLEIDRRNASRGGLTVSSKLLRIAHVQ